MNELVDIKSPISVNYEITPVCNLRCEFCFNADRGRQKPHPPLERVQAILDKLKEADVFEIGLFGGEFFTYPHWKEVIEYADEADFFMSFVSNGTLITEDVVETMKRHRIIHGAISLHGKKEVHDSIAGVEGSYARAVRGIKLCIEGGLGVSILYTLNRKNCTGLFETVKWLKEEEKLEVDDIDFGRLTPYGRAKDDWENSKLSLEDYTQVFPQIDRIKRELDVNAHFGDAFPLCLLEEKYQDLVFGCWQGTGFGHVDHQGNVRSCSIARGSYGNLLDTPLEEIWACPKLKCFRSLEWLPQKCRECDDFCGGGCSASRYDGGLFAPDEFLEEG